MIRTCLLFATRPRCTTFRRTSPRFDLFPLAFSHTPSLVSPPSAFADPRRPITACRHLHFATKQCRSLTSLDFVRFAPSCTTAAPREFAPLGLPSLATLSRLCMPLAAVQRDTRRQPIAHRQVARRRSCRVFTGLVSLALVALALFALARLLLSSNTMSKVGCAFSRPRQALDGSRRGPHIRFISKGVEEGVAALGGRAGLVAQC